MKLVDKLKAFIVAQDTIPKTIHIHPDALKELEDEKFVYILNKTKENHVKRFMGIELIPSETVTDFTVAEDDQQNERWVVKKEVKKIKEKYIKKDSTAEITKDMSLLFAYLGYLERELEDKTNYIKYLRQTKE